MVSHKSVVATGCPGRCRIAVQKRCLPQRPYKREPYAGGAQIFQKSTSHLQFLGARMMTEPCPILYRNLFGGPEQSRGKNVSKDK